MAALHWHVKSGLGLLIYPLAILKMLVCFFASYSICVCSECCSMKVTEVGRDRTDQSHRHFREPRRVCVLDV
jgi:hypothetical protein